MIRRTIHIALALLVLISSIGMVLRKHYCQDTLRDVALYVPAPNCHEQQMQARQSSCPLHQAAAMSKAERDGCCDDQAELIKVEDERPVPKEGSLALLLFDLPIFASLWSPTVSQTTAPDHLNYKPPLLVCDDPAVRLQTFRC